MGKHENLTGAERVARRRARLRAQGLRPKQFWVADLRDPKVRAEIDHAVAAIGASDERNGVMGWIESLNAEVLAIEPDYDWGPEASPEETTTKE